jgi:hypothetical protein
VQPRPQCWAYRSLNIALNGSAVHAAFPDWPANESVPIVELMQLPTRTLGGWISRGVNSTYADTTQSTVGIRTNCACVARAVLPSAPDWACAAARVLSLTKRILCARSHAASRRRPGAHCDVCERRGVAGLLAAVDRLVAGAAAVAADWVVAASPAAKAASVVGYAAAEAAVATAVAAAAVPAVSTEAADTVAAANAATPGAAFASAEPCAAGAAASAATAEPDAAEPASATAAPEP